jgi:uncharacterized protein (TIGR02302 family)
MDSNDQDARPTGETLGAAALDRRLRRARLRARLAIVAETVAIEAALPSALALLVVALAWMGLRDVLPGLAGAFLFWFFALAVVAVFVRAALRIARDLPGRLARTALTSRIEAASGLVGRELEIVDDRLADGSADAATRALWAAHRDRAATRIGRLFAGPPRPDLGRRDRFALGPIAAMALFVGWFAASGEHAARLAAAFGAAWPSGPADRLDVWVEPPAHTGLPPVSLLIDGQRPVGAERDDGTARNLPSGSVLVLRATTGEAGRAPIPVEAAATPAEAMTPADAVPARTGVAETRRRLVDDVAVILRRDGREVGRFAFSVAPDAPPTIAFTEDPTRAGRSGLGLSYEIADDWGVVSARARVLKPAVGRPLYDAPEFALTLPPGARHVGRARTVRDLTMHPFAGAELEIEPVAVDGAGQEGVGERATVRLPERDFRDPLARALIDYRRRLALDAGAIKGVAAALEALTLVPDRFQTRASVHLGLRHLAHHAAVARDDAAMRGVVDELWTAAVTIDAGDTADEAKAVQAAREALAEALRNGASDAEIERLTRELRQAMDRYLEALQEAARRNPEARDGATGQERRIDRKSLSDMLDRIEKLGRTGSREAAERLLSELGDTLQALRGARPGQSRGMAGSDTERQLGDMIRRQRDLMDRTHRADREGADAGERERLTQEQQALRDDLRRLRRSLEGGESRDGATGGEAGEGGEGEENGLDDADRAMDDAGRAIDRGDGRGAVGSQGRAIDGLRRGAREMARGDEPGDGREGNGEEDPLGRQRPSKKADGRRVGIPDEIDVERARRILEDIRRRLADPDRPGAERDYLDRLLEVE